MHQKCLEINDSWAEPHWGALAVSYQKRVVMCLVGKAAGTTWRRVLLRLTSKRGALALANANRHILHARAGAYYGNFKQISQSRRDHFLMGHYYKVLFVREPLERLISGYRDKMFRAVDYVRMRNEIKRKFRPNVLNRFAKNALLFSFLLCADKRKEDFCWQIYKIKCYCGVWKWFLLLPFSRISTTLFLLPFFIHSNDNILFRFTLSLDATIADFHDLVRPFPMHFFKIMKAEKCILINTHKITLLCCVNKVSILFVYYWKKHIAKTIHNWKNLE